MRCTEILTQGAEALNTPAKPERIADSLAREGYSPEDWPDLTAEGGEGMVQEWSKRGHFPTLYISAAPVRTRV